MLRRWSAEPVSNGMSTPPVPVIDAREVTRARQPGRALIEVVVTVTQAAVGLRQAVRVAADDERGARALAMLHCTLLSNVPRDLSPVSLALRCLEFEVSLDDGSESIAAPRPAPPAWVAPAAGPSGEGGRDGPEGGELTGYSVVIATDPRYWVAADGTQPTVLKARWRAELLADMARNVFPGLRCDLVPGPVEKLDSSSGPNLAVREKLEAWIEQRAGEMLDGNGSTPGLPTLAPATPRRTLP